MVAVVTDVLPMRGELAIEHGLEGIFVFLSSDGANVHPTPGAGVFILRADGWVVERQVFEVRSDQDQHAVFLPDLKLEDVPIGSTARWGVDRPSFSFAVPARGVTAAVAS